MIFGYWHGGSSYAGNTPEYLEIFDSIREAREAFVSRYSNGFWHRQRFFYADGGESYALTPAVDESASMELWLSDPRLHDWPHPDILISYGPRGGVQEVHAK